MFMAIVNGWFFTLYVFQLFIVGRQESHSFSFRPCENISCCAKCVSLSLPTLQTKCTEVSQSATCFSLIFDNDSELQCHDPYQLLGSLFTIQLMQRVNCCTVWCGEFYDVWFLHSDLLALKIFFVFEPCCFSSCQFGFIPIQFHAILSSRVRA